MPPWTCSSTEWTVRSSHYGLGTNTSKRPRCISTRDLQLKERAMDQTKPVEVPAGRYKPTADVMAFLEGL